MKKGFNLRDEMKAELDPRLSICASYYITAEESIAELKKRYIHAIPKWQIEAVRRTGE